MASQLPCVKNASGGYTFYASLVSQADTKIMQANPTLASGDVQIAIDDGAPANLGTLPAVDADFTKRVKVVLSQAETNGDNLTIIFSDAAGAQWCDLTINIQTAAQTFDTIDDYLDTEIAALPTAAAIADAVCDEVLTGHETADTVGRVLGAVLGRWRILNNQLLAYGLSGNLLFTFDLTNSAGSAASRLVYERTKA